MPSMKQDQKSGVGMLTGSWPFSVMSAERPQTGQAALLRRLGKRVLAAAVGLRSRLLIRTADSETALKIEARVALGPKKSITLVACCGRHYLVASAGEQIAPIVEVLPLNRPGRRTHARNDAEAAQ